MGAYTPPMGRGTGGGAFRISRLEGAEGIGGGVGKGGQAGRGGVCRRIECWNCRGWLRSGRRLDNGPKP